MTKDNNLPFDPSRFAMQSTGAEEFGTRKIRSVISVNKPGKMEWVRLFDHVDYLIPGAALLDLQDGGRMYLVEPEKIMPEPDWPDMSFADMLQIAFNDDHIVDRDDHPALRRLKGGM